MEYASPPITGTITKGQGLGTSLGFPTANIYPNFCDLRDTGVFCVKVEIEGETFRGIMNKGVRPTVQDEKREVIEVHLFDVDGDLYGKEITVQVGEKIRDEQKFSSLEELQEQIQKDVKACKHRQAK